MVARRPRRTAEERLSRLLVMLPWVMERGVSAGAPIPLSEVAERFALSESEVMAELELASMCGLPPYVDELIDVFIDEGMVYVGVPRLFTRPLRLNALEAFELLMAARSVMHLPGSDPGGPLGRGLAKLARALGAPGMSDSASDPSGALGLEVDLADPIDAVMRPILDEVVRAVEAAEIIEVQYWHPDRGDVAPRRLCPLQVFTQRGHWYLVAHDLDRRESSARIYRVDRMLEVNSTGEVCEREEVALPEPGAWFVGAQVEEIELDVDPEGLWITESYPVISVGDPDARGARRVRLAVVSRAWVERMLLRLGTAARVIAPEEYAEWARTAATHILAVYEDPAAR